jgi:heme/copper-type cytochrome/quinol oxidase subunit 4
MKIKELKQLATSEEFKDKPDVTKLATIYSLFLQAILVKTLYSFAIAYTLIFFLYLFLGMGCDWNIIKIICSYLVLVVVIKIGHPMLFDKYIKSI